jgi:hypothetical protein
VETEYHATLNQTETILLGKRVYADHTVTFVWAVHPHELFVHASCWIKDDKGRSLHLQGFRQVVLDQCDVFDYSQIGK